MSGADLMLFRRMRGLFWGMLLVGVIGVPTVVVLAMTVPSQMGLYSDQAIADLGGPMSMMEAGFGIGSLLALIAGVLLGATAGSVDLQRGVLRDLVLAGRVPWRIVLGRLLAASALLIGAMCVMAVLVVALATALPPVDGSIDWGAVGRDGFAYVPGLLLVLPFAAGVAMLVGSRGPAIAVYFVFALVLDNVLVAIPKVGDWWQHVSLSQADQQLQAWIRHGSSAAADFNDRSDWLALAIVLAWCLGIFVVGTVRLSKRDL